MKKIGFLLFLLALFLGQAWAEPATTLQAITETPIPPRDPFDLAARFRGLDLSQVSITPRREYVVGDRETFTIASSQAGGARQASLVLAGKNNGLYIWVEDQFIRYDFGQVSGLTNRLSDYILPRIRELFGEEAPISSDHHIYVFTVRNPGTGLLGFFSDADRFPKAIFPTSNEVNSFVITVNPQSVELYTSVLAHEFQHLVQANLDESEDTWFVEGFAELGSLIAAPEYFSSSARQDFYLESGTANQLNRWAYPDESTDLYYAGASLFLTYITQRVGEGWIRYVAAEPKDGLAGIQQALLDFGQPMSVDDLFADFVVANWLNDPALDPRYGYTLVPLSARARPTASYGAYPVQILGGEVNQYGTQYFLLENFQALNLQFRGAETAPLLPTAPQSGGHFLWSQRGNQGNARLLGRFDLRNTPSATLQFKTWFDVEAFWDYAYLSISIDNGATWQLLTTPEMNADNPNDRAFGMGYTGISGGAGVRPAALIGFNFGPGTLAIESIFQNTPAAQMGLAVGDEMVAINGEALTVGNFFRVFDQYRPDETIVLRVNRGGQLLDLPILLAAHPSRNVAEPILWLEQSVDLSAYAGHEVILSFDYVTDQATSYDGWLLEDVAIPEIGFFDDFESDLGVWERQGWVRITNEIPQKYLVQVIQVRGGQPVVTPILHPDAPMNSQIIRIEGGVPTVLSISGMAPVTRLAAPFELELSESNE